MTGDSGRRSFFGSLAASKVAIGRPERLSAVHVGVRQTEEARRPQAQGRAQALPNWI
jgi:hypothetical protein